MLNDVFDIDLDHPEMIPTRDGYGAGLIYAAEADKNVLAIGADVTCSTRLDWFRDHFPDRFFSIGIAEQNQMCIAAGLALMHKIPFVTNYAVFLSGRSWDQIRTTVCYNNLNVKLGGAHAGITVGADGATHQALEDIAVMRCLPNMKVVVPADSIETRKATIEAAKIDGPVYIRFGRESVPVITSEETHFSIGQAYYCRQGTDVAIIACGLMVYESLVAARKLEKEGLSVAVINNHTIKPIDKDTIIDAAKRTGAIVTAEEHQVMGGMGSAVLEVLAQEYPVPVKMVGANDCFGESGEPNILLKEYNINSESIITSVYQVLRMKGR